MAGLLVETKLFRPRTRPGLVDRPRLDERLLRKDGTGLTLVSAPAGFGKTTLLSAWASDGAAWVSLEESDQDPLAFWTYVLTALDRAAPGVAEDALTVLQSGPAPIETILNVQWFPDSRRLVVVGHEKGKKDRSYELSLGGGAPKPITPEGTSGAFVSPDGKWLVVITEDAVRLFPMDGGPLRDVGLRSEERVAGWLADSRALLVWSRTKPIVVERLDITTAKRTTVTTLAPSEMDGVTALNGVVFTPDGDHYVYTYPRLLSELFVVSGLK